MSINVGPTHRVQQLDRMLGMLTVALKVGPAVHKSRAYPMLERLGVLQRDPASWEVSTALSELPWGAQPFKAPPAEPPIGFDGPWPQTCGLDPRLHPAVIHIEREDSHDHLRNNAARYLGQVVRLGPGFAMRARIGPRLLTLDDDALATALTSTSFGQFVSADPSEAELSAFGDRVRPGARHAIVDLSFVPEEHALPGVYVAGTIVLLRREAADYRLLAIKLGERVLDPSDGAAWQLARYFVMQGAHTRLVLVTHPTLHFPTDSINAITRSVLPAQHILSRLLKPHTVFTLGLNKAVIHHRRSVLLNCQQEIYTPLAYDAKGIIELSSAGRSGVPGSERYTPYRFGNELFGDHVVYGRYRNAWHDVYQRFAAELLSRLPKQDPHVIAWADHICRWVPGFPSGAEIMKGDTLARTVATYICSVSVFHSGDHFSYAAIPPAAVPWRLRAPPPSVRNPDRIDPEQLVSPEDHFRHLLCHAMFFVPVVRRALGQVRYEFSEKSARAAVDSLRTQVQRLDATWQGSGFPTSMLAACSVHY
jgi:hypothetical protein